jgi:MFS family permease
MTRSLAPFFSLFLSTAILLIGDGLFSTLLPIRADMDGFSPASLGVLGAGFFAGSMLGAWFGPAVVMRGGHIRSFAVFASVASAIPLVHMLSSDVIAWVLLRVMTGFCLAGLYMIIESWLNEQATNQNRGTIFAVYRVVCFTGLILGQLTLNVSTPGGFELFAIVAILTSAALVPVCLTRSVQPAPIETHKISFKELWSVSPVGVLGCFAVGLTNGPFWALAPIYASEAGLGVQGVSIFMTMAILGGAVVQVPVGRLSDLIDRRWVLIGVLIGVSLSASFLAVALDRVGETGLYIGAFFFGAFALSLYSLCIAQANDHAAPHQFVLVASGLTLVFSTGAVVGPLLASALQPLFGIGAVFGLSVAVSLLFIPIVLGRILVRAAIPAEDREDFVAVPFARPASAPTELDPRADYDATEEPDHPPDTGTKQT